MADNLTSATGADTRLRISSVDSPVPTSAPENPRPPVRRLDVSAWLSTGDDFASWDELQAYLDRVRRRLEHLNGRAFGAGSDYLVGIVVNVNGIETARAIWAEEVEPLIIDANPRLAVRLPDELRVVDVSDGAALER